MKTNVLDPGTVEARGFGGGGRDTGDVGGCDDSGRSNSNDAVEGDKHSRSDDREQHHSKTRDEIAEEIEEFLKENNLSVKSELRCLLNIFVFVTALPCPAHYAAIHPGLLMKGMCYFPVIGTIIGTLVSQAFDFGDKVWDLPIIVVAAISTAFSLKITGCFHEDGLADTADGIGGGWSRKQILRIMTDSRLGTFGSAALILYLLTKVQLLAALGSSDWITCNKIYSGIIFGTTESQIESSGDVDCESHGAGPALIVAHALARWTAPYLIWRCDYIEEDGPKSQFYSFMIRAKFLVSAVRVVSSLVFSYVVSATLYGPILATKLIVVVWIFAECAGAYGRIKLGGVMGDFLGSTICVAELLIYSILAADGSVFDDCVKPFMIEVVFPLAADATTRNISLSERFRSLMQERPKFRLLTRFVILFIAYQVWCWLVGTIERKHNEKQAKLKLKTVKLNDANDSSNAPSSPEKEKAQTVLQSSMSTVIEKFNAVQTYLDVLAKPVGSLGTLEEWAARLSVLQSSLEPKSDNVSAIIFAGDHGVAASKDDSGEGCSLYPREVTRAILKGLRENVAAASVLAKSYQLNLSVIDVGVIGDGAYTTTCTTNATNGAVVVSAANKLPKGTRNFCVEPAMTIEEVDRCIAIGKQVITDAVEKTSCQIVALGEVGIGNTTTASTLVAALTGKPAADLCGGGAFASRTVNHDKIKQKIQIVETALEKHKGSFKESISILSKVGGTEIAALVGAMVEASDRNIAVLVDGFIVTVAALVAVRMKPTVCNALFFATKSDEKGQIAAIEQIQTIAREHNLPVPASPALSMGLRMGECTGAILAVPILQSSAAMITNMATIQEILG